MRPLLNLLTCLRCGHLPKFTPLEKCLDDPLSGLSLLSVL
jgi:hypothetical protein